MTPLVLITASGLAREVLAALGPTSGYAVRGILDDAPNVQSTAVGRTTVIGTIDQATEHLDAQLLVCAGRGQTRAAIVTRLARLGIGPDRYATFVDPGVVVPGTCTVGAGSILLARTTLTSDVTIGRHVVTMPAVTLTHDDRVDDFVTICAGVSLGGSVHVEQLAYLGMNSSVREHSVVGVGAVLGMGAVLLQDLPAGETWTGVPARAARNSASAATIQSGSIA